jgi:hypothetical protein
MNLCIYIHFYKTAGGGAGKTLGAGSWGMGALELGHWLPLVFMNFLSNRGALSVSLQFGDYKKMQIRACGCA